MKRKYDLTIRQVDLLKFVQAMHEGQVRKYTNEPYYNHCLEVSYLVDQFEDGCREIALCHDLFEDTDCDFKRLYDKMVEIGYSEDFSYKTCTCVDELSDEYTSEKYPYLNRKKRKIKEAQRLGTISYLSQTVKYADLINNIESIVDRDPNFAKVYIQEKEDILSLMTEGNKELFKTCQKSLQKSKEKLEIL